MLDYYYASDNALFVPVKKTYTGLYDVIANERLRYAQRDRSKI